MSDHAAFSATYSDFRLIKGRKVVQFVFELPLEQADMALKVVGGMPNPAAETWCAIARLDLNKTKEVMPAANVNKTTDTSPASETTPARAKNRYSMRAGILSNDPIFWAYLYTVHHIEFPDDKEKRDIAADFIRKTCGVTSRADILPNTPAATTFDLLETDFILYRDADKFVEYA